jgi:hypothetical protein
MNEETLSFSFIFIILTVDKDNLKQFKSPSTELHQIPMERDINDFEVMISSKNSTSQ